MRILAACCALFLCLPLHASQAQDIGHRIYLVPGIHFSTPAKAVVSLTSFIDLRDGQVGKGYIATVEGGPDAVKAHFGIANVTSILGYSLQLSGLRTRSRPLLATPNSSYAGTEAHLLISVFNMGVGFYAPVGNTRGRKGLLSLSAGLGF